MSRGEAHPQKQPTSFFNELLQRVVFSQSRQPIYAVSLKLLSGVPVLLKSLHMVPFDF